MGILSAQNYEKMLKLAWTHTKEIMAAKLLNNAFGNPRIPISPEFMELYRAERARALAAEMVG